MEQSIEKILSTIDDAISKFQDSVPGIQKLVYEELQPLLKQIKIKDGKLLNNLENLKLISTVKNKLQKIIISAEYKKSVTDFVDSFSEVSNLNNDYFKIFNQKFKPKKTLPLIKQLAIESTINDLLGQGMSSNVIDPIQQILNQNITSGGNYAGFQELLRDHILNNETGEGSMVKYTKQITTDAINQYNAQYHDAIAQDLQFNWGRYVGSNITTSREFCIFLTKKQWVNKTDLPNIIRGHIDSHVCKLSKTTGLPLGMIPGTNETNFKILRGGYNCGHQFFWVPDNAVPEDVRNKKELPAVPPKEETKTELILAKNKDAIAAIEKDKIPVNKELLDSLPGELNIEKTNRMEAYYHQGTNTIVIGNYNRGKTPRTRSEYFRNTVMPHELGHAIHNQKGIIKGGIVSEDFKKHFKDLQQLIDGKESEISSDWMKLYSKADQNQREQLFVMYDILGSLTRGYYGGGHPISYYRTSGRSEAEIFAHSVSLSKIDNEFVGFNQDMKAVIDAMKSKISEWL